MRKSSFLVLAVLIVFTGYAQSYQFKPAYSVKTVWTDYLKGYFYDGAYNYGNQITVNIGEKTLTFGDKVRPLRRVEFNKETNTYLLEPKEGKETEVKWTLYFLHVSSDDQPISLRVAQRYTGRDNKRDTFFETHTSDLREISWDDNYYNTKGMKIYYSDKDTMRAKAQEFYNMNSVSQRTFFSMRGNHLTWKETSKDGETKLYHLNITEVRPVNSNGMVGIDMYCQTADELGLPRYYRIFYGTWDRQIHYKVDKYFKWTAVTELVMGREYWLTVFM